MSGIYIIAVILKKLSKPIRKMFIGGYLGPNYSEELSLTYDSFPHCCIILCFVKRAIPKLIMSLVTIVSRHRKMHVFIEKKFLCSFIRHF